MEKRVSFGEWLTIGAFVVSAIVWAVRIEGRVSAQADALAAIKEQQSENIQQLRQDLAYIRSRIDQATAQRTPTYTGSR